VAHYPVPGQRTRQASSYRARKEISPVPVPAFACCRANPKTLAAVPVLARTAPKTSYWYVAVAAPVPPVSAAVLPRPSARE
jgi:hypothetical protein